jgi:DNA-binding beta-propeller fold protein YncE
MGKLKLPINSHVDEAGNLYIADGNRKQVVIFDTELKFKHAITLKDDAKPTDVFTDNEKIWIAAIDNHEIQVFNKSDYSFSESFPKKNSSGDGMLYQPANLFVDDSLIYISDIGACKIIQYDKKMDFQNSFGSAGRGLGQFTRPKGISADKEGFIYVVDAAFENVQIFNPEGQLMMNFGGTYSGPGGMWLPADVTVDYQNRDYFIPYVNSSFHLEYLVFVSNQYGPDKISVYGFVSELKK